MDFTVFGYFAALCIVSGMLFGIAPALRSSKPDLVGVLKEGAHSVGQRRGGWLSSGLVVFQFALTLVLLTGAGMFVRSLMNWLSVNPFVPATQLTMASLQLPDSRYKDGDARQRFYDRLLPRLRELPGVSHAAIASDGPGLGANRKQIELEHAPIATPAQRPWIAYVVQSPGYLETIHLPLLEGRDFNESDGTAHREAAIVTRDAAAQLVAQPGPDGQALPSLRRQEQSERLDYGCGYFFGSYAGDPGERPEAAPLRSLSAGRLGSTWRWWWSLPLIRCQAMRMTVQGLDSELPLNDPSRVKDALCPPDLVPACVWENFSGASR